MQGFFIKANDLPDRPLVIPVRAQVNNGIHPRYKSETTLTLLKIEVTSGKLIDETIIRFNSKSTIGRDNDYDAIKAGFSVSGLSVWSTLNREKYVINSLPPPREKFEIPVSVHSDKQATVSLAIREKRNLDGYAIILRDIVTGNQIDLNNGGVVTAEVQSGETNNRFVLSVMMGNTGIDEVTGMNGRLTAYYMNSGVYIIAGLPVTGVEGEFVIYDINGRALASGKMLDINGSQQILDVALGNGLYIVEFKAKGFRKTGKLAVY
ncbi:MAG: T9SS type A sorting domain-containing protein [Bacteroidales bacterium]